MFNLKHITGIAYIFYLIHIFTSDICENKVTCDDAVSMMK